MLWANSNESPASASTTAVRPFADERFMDYSLAYRNLDISRWNILSSAAEKLRAVEEKQRDGSVVYQLEAGDDDADADYIFCRATVELLDFYITERYTKQDANKFQRLVEKARQEFRLYDYLTTADSIQHDSSVESVIEGVPEDMIASIGYFDVRGFVERHIGILKDWEATKLYYEFKYFLPECCWITDNAQDPRDFKKLKEDATFLDRGFHMIPDEKIRDGFYMYVTAMCMAKEKFEERKNDYINRIDKEFERARLSFDKCRKTFPVSFTEPIHFIVFKEREEKYTIQHPVVEIAIIRAFFHGIPLDFYEKKCMYPNAENAARFAASPPLNRQGSEIL